MAGAISFIVKPFKEDVVSKQLNTISQNIWLCNNYKLD
jgi:hypothetical protein